VIVWQASRRECKDCRASNRFWQALRLWRFDRHAVQRGRGPRPCHRLIIARGALVAVGPETIARQRDLRVGSDIMARRGAEFEHLQPVAEQIDSFLCLGYYSTPTAGDLQIFHSTTDIDHE